MHSFFWFVFNICCLLLYLIFSWFVIFLLCWFNILKGETYVKYRFNIIDFIFDFTKVFVSDIKNRDPDTFLETGIVIYEGWQGSGKTLSMVRDVMLLQHKYPKVKVIGNINYQFQDQNLDTPNNLIDFTNDIYGVISQIDELGVLFNNRDFKNFDKSMLQIIFENRKCRRLLLGTVQKFKLCDSNIRIQCNEVRSCFTILGCVTGYIRKKPIFDEQGSIVYIQ